MIEVVLNFAWLVIAVASYILLIRRLATRDAEVARVPGCFRSAVALGCLLAILFPIISVSPDLRKMQSAEMEVAENRPIVKKSGMQKLPSLGKKLDPGAFIVSRIALGVRGVNVRGIAPPQTVETVCSLPLAILSRASPTSRAPRNC